MRPDRRRHLPALLLLAAMSLVWTWPLALHLRDHIPGLPGDNYSFLWNLWWMRKVLATSGLDFFHSGYLLHPFGVDLVNHPHTAAQAYVSATAFASLSVIEAENLYIIGSVFLNGACAYVLAVDLVGDRRLALLAGLTFGGSPYVAAHLLGHFDLLTAWVIPLFALCWRRAIRGGRAMTAIGCGAIVAAAAYSAYYYVVYLAVFAVAYLVASWQSVDVSCDARPQTPALFTVRLAIVGALALGAVLIAVIASGGGGAFTVAGLPVSVKEPQNPLLAMWILAAGWMLSRWRLVVRVRRPPAEAFWRGVQALMITTAAFAVLCLPLIAQAFRLTVSGRYVSQVYFWRSAPRGVDALAPLMGSPFHPLYGDAVSRLYQNLGLDRIEAVGWLGIVPMLVLWTARGTWLDSEEARRWKIVLIVFAVWALGPFATAAGLDLGLPLPQALARLVPLVDNARMPGRAMVCVYLALGVLMGLRLGGLKSTARGLSHAAIAGVIALLALDYLNAPVPLTALHRPAVYEQLASIRDNGAVIEVPFGIGDGLTGGRGSQDRRLLYYATIHGHPVVGGYIGRMPPGIAQAYDAMPVVGNLLRLSSGGEPIQEQAATALPFRYLVLDTRTASAEMVDYLRSTLDIDLIASGEGRELYAVQGVKASNLRALRASGRGGI